MTERDLTKNPYTADEQRVCDYLQQRTNGMVGCGDDPIGFLLASYTMLVNERNDYRDKYLMATAEERKYGYVKKWMEFPEFREALKQR